MKGENNMGNFNIHVNVMTKVVESSVEGIMSVEDAANFILQYQKAVCRIPTSEYTLFFDCRKLEISPPESQKKLEECFELYKQSDFKKIVFKAGDNSVLKTQLSRIAEDSKLNRYKVE